MSAHNSPARVTHEFVEGEDSLSPADHGALVQVGSNPLAQLNKRTTGFNRQEIVNAFHNAFELIGGMPRLAVWGDNNPGEFYKLYAKLLPSSSQVDLTGEQTIVVKHVLPRPHDYKADIASAVEEDEGTDGGA